MRGLRACLGLSRELGRQQCLRIAAEPGHGHTQWPWGLVASSCFLSVSPRAGVGWTPFPRMAPGPRCSAPGRCGPALHPTHSASGGRRGCGALERWGGTSRPRPSQPCPAVLPQGRSWLLPSPQPVLRLPKLSQSLCGGFAVLGSQVALQGWPSGSPSWAALLSLMSLI